MKIDDVTKASLLYDFYGGLLTKRQQQVMELYHEENLSLSEIADEFTISRQAVHDALKNAEKALDQYEDNLGLVAKFRRSSEAVKMIDDIIDGMISGFGERDDGYGRDVIENLNKIKDIIDKLEE